MRNIIKNNNLEINFNNYSLNFDLKSSFDSD